MDQAIALAPGAEGSALARWLRDRLQRSIDGDPACRHDLAALRAAVAFVCPDRRLSVTLRFDHGYVTIHDGMLGTPDVTFCADYPILESLLDLPLGRRGRWPAALGRADARPWRRAVLELATGELKIYGLYAHPRTVLRVLRLLGRRATIGRGR